VARDKQITHTIRIPTRAGAGPHTRTPVITAEIRVRYPTNSDQGQVAQAVLQATESTLAELDSNGGWLLLAPLTPFTSGAAPDVP